MTLARIISLVDLRLMIDLLASAKVHLAYVLANLLLSVVSGASVNPSAVLKICSGTQEWRTLSGKPTYDLRLSFRRLVRCGELIRPP